MKLRNAALAAALLAAPLLAACGGDDATPPTTTLVPGAAQPDADGRYVYATGPDDVVLSISNVGGFVPVGWAFSNTPSLLVTGDGRVFTPGVITMEYPGPLVHPTQVATLSPEGIQALLALAADNGLLAEPPVYADNEMVADASTTVVQITVGGTTYEHSAYALGLTGDDQPEQDEARRRLATFVDSASDLEAVVPDGSLSTAELYAPTAYEIQAMPADPAGIEGAVVTAWASDTGVSLAAATECVAIPATDAAATALLNDGTAASVFTEGEASYQVFVRPQLPGSAAC